MYSVRLNDGSVINNLELNGNNFIPETLDKTIFENNLEKVVVMDDDGNEEELFNQKVQFTKIGDAEAFILLDKTKEEELIELLADLTKIVLLGGM